MSERWYRVDCRAFCGAVCVDSAGIVVATMPVLARFRGQPFARLRTWLRHRFGDVTFEELPSV